MAGREVIRLGLFPELGYFQPPNLIEDETETERQRSERRSICTSSWRKKNVQSTPSILSSRTASPSVVSSNDLKEDVLAVLKRRFPASKNSDGGRWINRVSEMDHDSVGSAWKSRKRKMSDAVSSESDEPAAKQARRDGNNGTAEPDQGLETGTVSVARPTTNGSHSTRLSVNCAKRLPRSFGLLEPDEVELGIDEQMETADETPIRTPLYPRVRPLYSQRIRKSPSPDKVADSEVISAVDIEEEEERREALAAFRAGQEFEQRKLRNWIKATATTIDSRSEKRSETPTRSINVVSDLPSIVLVPPSVSTMPPSTLFQFATPATTTKPTDIALPVSTSPAISLAPITTVTWSTMLATPIAAVPPLATSSFMSGTRVSDASGSTFNLPPTMTPVLTAPSLTFPSVSSSTADVSVSVTLPAPVSKSSEPSTSMTFLLPSIPTTTPSSGSAPTGGFSFTFTGQPVGMGQFNFAQLDSSSTNIFSSVGSAQTVARRKPAATSSSYSARRRHR